jgi:hypothetical protein
MSDIYERVTGDEDIIRKILRKVPGFGGYVERSSRRAADKMLREAVANRFEEQWKRISGIQRDLISQGGIDYIQTLEAGAIKLRQFIDRIRTASYGYSAFFEATKVNEEELAQVYQYDLAMLDMEDGVIKAIDNIEASIGSDGLPAAIRNLTSVAQNCLDTFNRRSEVMRGGPSQSQ